MRVGVNLLAFQPDRIGGLEHYVRRVLALLVEQTADEFVLFVAPGVDPGFAERAGRLRVRAFDLEAGDLALARAMSDEALDLWWCPWVVWRPLRPPVPVVVTVPDLQHEHLPDAFTPEERQERRVDYLVAVHCAHAVVTFSNHTRDDVCGRYGVPGERVFAIHLDAGYDWAASEPSPGLVAEMEAKAGRGFLYYPANTWPHKDHATLLAALRRLADGGERHRLVLTGAGDHGRDRLGESIRELGLGDSVVVLGTVSPAEVRALYRLASAVVFPSRFEGFGMPLVEGMRSGVPVLASDATSLPEIGGDAVAYFRGGDVAHLAEQIHRITADDSWRAQLVTRGSERAAGFSWESTARATAEVFAFAVRSGPPDTPVAVALRGVAERLLSQLAAVEADREARLDLIHRCEEDRAARLDIIERLIARIREASALIEEGRPRSYHGVAWPWEVVRVRRVIDAALRMLRDLVS